MARQALSGYLPFDVRDDRFSSRMGWIIDGLCSSAGCNAILTFCCVAIVMARDAADEGSIRASQVLGGTCERNGCRVQNSGNCSKMSSMQEHGHQARQTLGDSATGSSRGLRGKVLCKWCMLFSLAVGGGQAIGDEHAVEKIHFGRDIRPILANRCFKCHGPDASERQADLRLDQEAPAVVGAGETAIIFPGDPEQSSLFQRITQTDPQERMPPAREGPALTESERQKIRQWIEQGAERTAHWAFVIPEQRPPPSVRQQTWPRGEIDAFVLARLEKDGLAPAAEADRHTLIRRLSFDLRGLPPSVEEVQAFARDPAPDAYEKLVDAMLESPHYGERMAQDWLDLARYADTTGFSADSPRPMWLYRDWVIGALNDNLPFDQFTIAQLAGDLLPGNDPNNLIATGFHRSSMQALGNNPRKEEFRVKGIIDRVNTTARVFLGLTMGCAECHDHKFDPITQKEYYGMFAIFNNVPHYGENFAVHGPRIRATSPLAQARGKQIDQALAMLAHKIPPPDVQRQAQRQTQWEGQLARLITADPKENPDLVARWPLEKENFLRVADAEKLRLSGDFTITAVIQTTAQIGDIVCKYDSERGERAYVFGVGGEGEANAEGGNLYAWISSEPDRFEGIQIYGSIPVNDGKEHHVALVFRAGESVDLYVDGRRDTAARRAGIPPAHVAQSRCDLLIGAGYGLKENEKKYSLIGSLADVHLYKGAFPLVVNLGAVPEDVRAALKTPVDRREREQKETLRRFFVRTDRSHFPADLRLRIEQLEQERALLEQAYEAQVMREMETPRPTHIHLRGNYLEQGEQVEPTLPQCLPTASVPLDRLALARWLVDKKHPLTARVAVNRFWQHYFGTGLVSTPDDFGRQGTWPSHPQLLDHLAVTFMESDWDMKAMHRQIVHSATYRQSSRVGCGAYARDPANRLLARGPRRRLPAEQIRDNALAISGLLSTKYGGPSVYPPQPAGILEEKGQLQYHPVWITSTGENRYRRGLYVYWKRMHLYPSLATFGASTRERCTVKRPLSNTPLQALVLLNDPVFVEAARNFGLQILLHAGPSTDERIDYALTRCLGRPATPDEKSRYAQFVREQTERFAAAPERAEQWIAPETTLASQTPLAPQAAWTLLAATLLNLDETISKP